MHWLVVDTHEKKPRAKLVEKIQKIKNKHGKHTKTNNKNTHTSFSCCCCGGGEGRKIKSRALFLFLVFGSYTSHTPCRGGWLHRRRKRFGLFYLVDDLMDWSSCWNLLNADWPGWPDRVKFDWRVVVTKKQKNENEKRKKKIKNK